MAAELLSLAGTGKKGKIISLLNRGVHVNATNENGETALFFAARSGRVSTVKALLKRGADPNRRTSFGQTPLIEASRLNFIACVDLLIQHGAWITAKSYVEEALVMKKDTPTTDCIPACQLFEAHFSNTSLTSYEQFQILPASWKGTEVSVKTLHRDTSPIWDAMHEAEMLRSLRHPHILLAFGWSSSTPGSNDALVCEPIWAGNIASVVYKQREKIPSWDRINILLSIAKAGQFLHYKGIRHNFINSESVYVIQKWSCKLGNFEFVSTAETSDINLGNLSFLRHLPYLAPEVAVVKRTNHTSDIYSFGAFMWELLARKRPWSWLSDEEVAEKCSIQAPLKLPIHPRWPKEIQDIIKFSMVENIKERESFSYCIQGLTQVLCAYNDLNCNKTTEFAAEINNSRSGERGMSSQSSRNISAAAVESMYVSMAYIQGTNTTNERESSPKMGAQYERIPMLRSDPMAKIYVEQKKAPPGIENPNATHSISMVEPKLIPDSSSATKRHSNIVDLASEYASVRPKSAPVRKHDHRQELFAAKRVACGERSTKSASTPVFHAYTSSANGATRVGKPASSADVDAGELAPDRALTLAQRRSSLRYHKKRYKNVTSTCSLRNETLSHRITMLREIRCGEHHPVLSANRSEESFSSRAETSIDDYSSCASSDVSCFASVSPLGSSRHVAYSDQASLDASMCKEDNSTRAAGWRTERAKQALTSNDIEHAACPMDDPLETGAQVPSIRQSRHKSDSQPRFQDGDTTQSRSKLSGPASPHRSQRELLRKIHNIADQHSRKKWARTSLRDRDIGQSASLE